MSKYFSLFLLLTTVALTTTTTNLHHLPSSSSSSSPAPSPATLSTSPAPNSPPPPPPEEYMQQQQLKNIIDALIGAGDFAAWANILFNPSSNHSSFPHSTIPSSATIFLPANDALSRLSGAATGAYSFDPFIIPYHFLPRRLTFSDLRLFRTHTRLPTLLPSKTILITDDDPSHFTIDGSLITQPDVYSNAAVCVHGVANILDYALYGDADQTPPPLLPPPSLPPADDSSTPEPPQAVSSVAAALCVHFFVRFVAVVCVLLRSVLYAVN